MGFEYTCEQCGARFLAYKLADNTVRLCSDKCERGRTAAQRRAWRDCGVAIEAVRATKRFCSDLCRSRSHNQRRREAADD